MKYGCVFCRPNWGNLNHVAEPHPDYAIFTPLSPVVPGHVLVIAAEHTDDASRNYVVAGKLMEIAAAYVLGAGIQANIITSVGPAATQTVFHTHLHVVPRVEGDGLLLPWSGQ